MLRVTIEVLPGGSAARARRIGTLNIGNVESLPDNHASYEAAFLAGGGKVLGRVSLSDFDRDRGAWALVCEVLGKFAPGVRG